MSTARQQHIASVTIAPSFVPAGQSEPIFHGLLKMWLAIEFEDFPGWFDYQQAIFDLIQANLNSLGAQRYH